MKKILYLILYIYISGIWTGCNQSPKSITRSGGKLDYARNFYIEKRSGYKILHIVQAYPGAKEQKWILIKRGENPRLPDSLAVYPQLKVPLRSVVPMSTTHLIYLLALGEAGKVTGFPHIDYITMPYFRKRAAEGKMVELGSEMKPDMERIVRLKPDAVLVFSTGDDGKDFSLLEQAGIPVIYVSEWMERHPLGRAEWIKFFGALFDKDKQADSIFDKIKEGYIRIKTQSAENAGEKPKVLQAAVFRNVWYVAGGNTWAGIMIKDAGGKFLPENDTSSRSLRLSQERAYQLLMEADIWINSGNDISFKDDSTFLNTKKIIRLSDLKPSTDTVSFFEWSPLYPDKVLRKLNMTFFEN